MGIKKKKIFNNDKAIILWLKFAYLSGGYNTSDDYKIIFDKQNNKQEDPWIPIFIESKLYYYIKMDTFQIIIYQ